MSSTTTAGMEDVFLRDLNRSEGDYKASFSGDIESVTGVKNLEQSLLHRLLTRPGTLIHRPDYGVGLQDYVGSVLSFETKRRLAVRIDEQFRKDPRVIRVREISVQEMPGETFGVVVSVKVEASGLGDASFEFGIGAD